VTCGGGSRRRQWQVRSRRWQVVKRTVLAIAVAVAVAASRSLAP